jgi:transposase-like protein
MKREELKAFAREAAKEIKTQGDLKEFSKVLNKITIEAALEGELDEHLGYERYESSKGENYRNGYSNKRVKTENGNLELEVPRDREGSFEPQLVKKHQRRVSFMDERILYLYAKGMTTREISATFEGLYGVEVSPSLISKVTDRVMEEVIEWQNRVLDEVYPVVYLDCLVMKVKQEGRIINKSSYLALGINLQGKKELLGMWLSEKEGSKFWLNILTELQNRGLKDILIACVDGLKGFPEAIEAVYPKTQVQLCIVHMVRNSLRYVSYKDYRKVSSALKQIYQSATEEQALQALEEFTQKWQHQYPQIGRSWKNAWPNLNTLFQYPDPSRRAIYTTNAIESLNSVIRSAIGKRKIFPDDNALRKVVYLATQQASKKWTMPIRDWKATMSHFTILFDERLNNFV